MFNFLGETRMMVFILSRIAGLGFEVLLSVVPNNNSVIIIFKKS